MDNSIKQLMSALAQSGAAGVKEAVNNGTLERKVYDQFIALEKESQVTKGYLDQKLAKKLNKKAEFKKATINYHHYRKPPM